MKQFTIPPSWIFLFSVLACIGLGSCGGGEQPAECTNPITLLQALPNNNPAGGSFLVKGSGFGPDMELYVGNLPATILEYNDSFLVSTVPSGLLGGTTLSMRLGGCIASLPYEVTSSFPSNLPAGPSSYVLPTPGLAFGLHITSDIAVSLINPYDSTHLIRLEDSSVGLPKDDNVTEFMGSARGNGTWYGLDGQGDTVYSEPLVTEETIFFIKLNRSDANSPFEADSLIGRFQTLYDLEINGDLYSNNFLVLTSVLTGRQYIFSSYN